ncbi:MAG TPA: hypothetical protein VFS56_11695 [Gemmatimonadaceae bacterium]|nr:hypothetical protein [Gemmatimonadaceae bacterium]
MKSQGSNRSRALLYTVTAFLVVACEREGASSAGDTPNAAGRDTVSEVALSEDGLGPVQIGMQLSEAVDMGVLSENPNLKPECDYVFPAVGAGIPEGVSVMVVRGRVARIDIDTGAVTTEEGAKLGDTEERLHNLYGDDVKVTQHKYIEKGHYFTVAGDSASAGKALVFETDGRQVTMFRAGRFPEVGWVEACS